MYNQTILRKVEWLVLNIFFLLINPFKKKKFKYLIFTFLKKKGNLKKMFPLIKIYKNLWIIKSKSMYNSIFNN